MFEVAGRIFTSRESAQEFLIWYSDRIDKRSKNIGWIYWCKDGKSVTERVIVRVI